MSKVPTSPKRKVTPLTADQITLLQEFINTKPPGVYDAMDLIPEDYLEYFSAPQTHGGQFGLAVRDGKFENIEARGMNLNSKHMRYAIHGGFPG